MKITIERKVVDVCVPVEMVNQSLITLFLIQQRDLHFTVALYCSLPSPTLSNGHFLFLFSFPFFLKVNCSNTPNSSSFQEKTRASHKEQFQFQILGRRLLSVYRNKAVAVDKSTSHTAHCLPPCLQREHRIQSATKLTFNCRPNPNLYLCGLQLKAFKVENKLKRQ